MNTCYSLTASDEPLQVRYVGTTTRPLKLRLAHHFQHTHINPRKIIWFRDAQNRGARIVITKLSGHATKEEALCAELAWIRFWQRYCSVLNMNHAG